MTVGRGVEGVLSVLCIEDNASNARLVERLMARRGQVRLRVATSGAEGLRLAAELRPDLVLLDLHPPDLAGPEFERFSALSAYATTAVAALVAKNTHGVRPAP